MAIIIPKGLIDKYYEACDFFLNNDLIGRSCTIVYPPRRTSCANCTVRLIGSNSHNTYRNGGPAPFSFGSCPLCGGNGYKEVEVTDTIRLRIYWNRADWIKVGGISIDNANVMVIGSIIDVPKISRAIELHLATSQTEAKYRATLVGKPVPHGFGRNRYFVAYLKGV
jgi:hypothetical protein